MRWTSEQLKQFDEQGYLVVPELFDADEIARLNAEIPRLCDRDGPENLRERNSDSVRSVISPASAFS